MLVSHLGRKRWIADSRRGWRPTCWLSPSWPACLLSRSVPDTSPCRRSPTSRNHSCPIPSRRVLPRSLAPPPGSARRSW